jgi:hypothetical protein
MEMLTTIMKYIAIVTLLGGIFLQLTPNLRSYLDFVVAAGAVFVAVQAINLRKYLWVGAIVVIFVLFNPFWRIGFSFRTMVALQIMAATVFAVSLQMLKTSPRLTIASVTDTDPRAESL